MSAAPQQDELQAYLRGALDGPAAEAVAAWIDGLEPAAQEALFAQAPHAEPGFAAAAPAPTAAFTPQATAARYRAGAALGAGGMGLVQRLDDTLLERTVALKRCRNRRPDEAVASHARLQQVFAREAALTAGLEHPGIVPVHDVGVDAHGAPAFVMKLLEGEPLDTHLASIGSPRATIARRVELVLRIADAIAYAHGQGVVHRDLKPENVIVGRYGAVTVIDWGLAAPSGADTGSAVGTPGWSAPEQDRAAPADPRMDVWGLGALLRFCFTDALPTVAPDNTMPAGLRAVADRCLEPDPADRYAGASAVADELRRWLEHGATLAQNPGPLLRAWHWSRRHGRLIALGLAAGLLALLAGGWALYAEHQRRLAGNAAVRGLLNDLMLDDLQAVHLAHQQLRRLAAVADPQVVAAAQRGIAAAETTIARRQRLDAQRAGLERLAQRYRRTGPWAHETHNRLDLLRELGFVLRRDSVQADARTLRAHPLASRIAAAMIQLQRAALLADSPLAPRLAAVIPQIIAAGIDDHAYAALARIYASSRVGTHQLELAETADDLLARALENPICGDILLQGHRPVPALAAYATARIAKQPAAFWPRLVASRLAFNAGRSEAARDHALIALGAAADSIWPRLALSYAAMLGRRDAELLRYARSGRRRSPDNLEFLVLEAVGLARSGQLAAARELVRESGAAPHFNWHLSRPSDHPMDRSVRALVAAGIAIPAAEPRRGPRVAPDPDAPPPTNATPDRR